MVEVVVGSPLSKDYVCPKTPNNYKGDEVIPITILESEICKTAIIGDLNGNTINYLTGVWEFDNKTNEVDDEKVGKTTFIDENMMFSTPKTTGRLQTTRKYIHYPTPGFVIKSKCDNGNEIYVNVCGYSGISDVLLSDGSNCPYVVGYSGGSSKGVLTHIAVVHTKYIMNICSSKNILDNEIMKSNLSEQLLEQLNKTSFKNNNIIPACKNLISETYHISRIQC